MNYRTNAAFAIGRRQLFESLIHPGFYVALTVGCAIAYAFTSGFVRSIDSSGFDYSLNPLYNFTGGVLSGAFGSAFVARVFADGPFLFTVHIAFLPVLLYLAMNSVYRFGNEKSSGAIELLCYGPSDGTAYFLASFLKDGILTLVALSTLLVFFIVAGIVDNLAITRTFLLSLVVLLVASLCVYAYAVLVSVLAGTANTALALFVAVLLLFGISMVGSEAIVSGYVESLSRVAAWIVQWFSPFFYWSVSMKGQTDGDVGLFFLGLVSELAVAVLILVGSHYVVKSRGVRA